MARFDDFQNELRAALTDADNASGRVEAAKCTGKEQTDEPEHHPSGENPGSKRLRFY